MEYARLKTAGVKFLSEPVGMLGGARFCRFKHPDGTIVELFDFGTGQRRGRSLMAARTRSTLGGYRGGLHLVTAGGRVDAVLMQMSLVR
jgi:hypothetical protein